jgi:hypothetical protein
MDPNRFGAITKLFAQRRHSRRAALTGVSAALGAGALAPGAAAQNAPPSGDAATPVAPNAMTKTAFLFVQSFQSGHMAPTEGVDGRYTVTLEAGVGQTVYFSDRPERIVGATPTPQFLAGLGFPDIDPPNAALVVESAPGETGIAVVELFHPVYDEATHTATYEVAVLATWETSTDLGFSEVPTDLAALAPAFGAAHLFIDDCPDAKVGCIGLSDKQHHGFAGTAGLCWDWSTWTCSFCDLNEAIARCNATIPACNGDCWAFEDFG